MSLRDVAKKSGCSAGVLSQIELNQASPTLRTLEKICRALDVTIFDFLRPPPTSRDKPLIISTNRETCETVMQWSKAKMLRLVPEDKISFTSLILRLEPGGMTATRHSLTSRKQISFVLRGEVALEISF
jgi:transcriptional regulator with XRE-family HTH domain